MCSIVRAAREMQSRATVRYQSMPLPIAKIKKKIVAAIRKMFVCPS